MGKIADKSVYWLQLLLLPLYWLSFLVPRDKRLWLFGSTFGRRFADNPRYLYLYINSLNREPESSTDIRPVWISHSKETVDFLNNRGCEAYYYHSLKGIALALRAGVYIYDNYSKDINFWQSGGAVKVNLWHGVGNKRINHDNRHDRVRHPRNLFERFTTFPRRLSDEKPSDYVLCTSKEMGEYFAGAFKSAPGHVLSLGYPRCDALFEENREVLLSVMSRKEEALLTEIEGFVSGSAGDSGISGAAAKAAEATEKEEAGKAAGRVIIYLPTFRESETKFLNVMDMEAFGEWLYSRGYLFVMKLHPKSGIGEALKESFGGRNGNGNIIIAPADADVYTFLGKGDMLVTDYSSVYTDYMLLERPVVAFCYDKKEYEINSRDYFIDQEKYMPELMAENMEQLMDCIDRAFEKDERLPDRLKSRERMFDMADGNACRRVFEGIRRILQ